MSQLARVAVLLAAGRGTRMRRADDSAELSVAQRIAANSGLKALIPDSRGRPFLHHILAGLAVAGIERVIVVVSPDHGAMDAALDTAAACDVHSTVVVQEEPLGTADALLAAEQAVGSEPFVVLNSDNLYPVEAMSALVGLDEPGLIAFDVDALVRDGNIEPERVRSFAMVAIDAGGYLERLVEKPDAQTAKAMAGSPVSMNLWRFDAAIFDACRRVPMSSRGELELPEAVTRSISAGMRYRAVPLAAGVLDLSNRGDIAGVAALLGERELLH